ncbi:MAG TPA: hypothetical protein VGA42_03445 [Gemmatimonadales bacterium]
MSVLPLPEPRAERLGAIDVGSNCIRLLVADWDPRSGGIAVVDEVKAQPRLAQGLATTGRLDEVAMERALEALERMDEIARRRGVRRLGAVATAAVRDALNGEEFVRRVQTRLGIPLQIIDEETEARLSYRSVAMLELRPQLPIILLSGMGLALSQEAVNAVGIRRVLTKPVSSTELSEAIQSALSATARA